MEAINKQLLDALEALTKWVTVNTGAMPSELIAAKEAIRNASSVHALNAETFVQSALFGENTGGNIYNDVITLKNGYVIRVSEDIVGIYESQAADEVGDACVSVSFDDLQNQLINQAKRFLNAVGYEVIKK